MTDRSGVHDHQQIHRVHVDSVAGDPEELVGHPQPMTALQPFAVIYLPRPNVRSKMHCSHRLVRPLARQTSDLKIAAGLAA